MIMADYLSKDLLTISQNQYRCFCLTMAMMRNHIISTVTNDFPLKYRQSGAFVDAVQSPLLDEWGGSWTFSLNLPMPTGLPEGFYEVIVTATNVDDETLSVSEVIPVEIRKTASVEVETDISDQSYIPGDIAQSMTFEVTNNGNIR